MRPCTCDRVDVGHAYDPDAHCRSCWLFHHNPSSNAEWGGAGAVPVNGEPYVPTPRVHGVHPAAAAAVSSVLPRRRPCKLLGEEVDVVECPSCNRKAGVLGNGKGYRVKVFNCPVHSRCTRETPVSGAHVCADCPDYVDPLYNPDPGRVRHLLFHLWPVRHNGGERWRWHVEQLRRRLPLWNGRRLCAVVTDAASEPASLVRELAGDVFDEILEFPNDPGLREVATFEALFGRVASADPGEAILYAHSKGVLRSGHRTVPRWAAALYQTYCDHWPFVRRVLQGSPVAGSFKKLGRGWPQGESPSEWHYSGSWCWFRGADLFAKDWRRIDRFWSGIEPWPSLHFPADQAGVIFHEAPVPDLNLYSEAVWDGTVGPALERWEADRLREEAPAAAAPAGLKVELGGGSKPRGAPWLNVDRGPGPGVDYLCDFEGEALPFADATVGELYSAHCFEHVANLKGLLREVARVCKAGAKFELRVPHWLSPMAMCHGHAQVIPPEQVDHWCGSALDYWWAGSPRRLRHLSTEQVRGGGFGEAKALHPGWSDEQILKFVPGAAHEVIYRMVIVPHE